MEFVLGIVSGIMLIGFGYFFERRRNILETRKALRRLLIHEFDQSPLMYKRLIQAENNNGSLLNDWDFPEEVIGFITDMMKLDPTNIEIYNHCVASYRISRNILAEIDSEHDSTVRKELYKKLLNKLIYLTQSQKTIINKLRHGEKYNYRQSTKELHIALKKEKSKNEEHMLTLDAVKDMLIHKQNSKNIGNVMLPEEYNKSETSICARNTLKAAIDDYLNTQDVSLEDKAYTLEEFANQFEPMIKKLESKQNIGN